MTFRIMDLCRGDGKGYINISISDEKGEWFTASAVASNGREIPCAVYDMAIPGEDIHVAMRNGNLTSLDERQIVVAVPLLDETTLVVYIYDNYSEKPIWSFPFVPLWSKVRSRLTYRMRPHEAARIRGIDQIRLEGQPYVFVNGIYPLDIQNKVCRFQAIIPYEKDVSYHAEVFGSNAEPIGQPPIVLEDNIVLSRTDSNDRLRELTFSVVLSTDDMTICIAVIPDNQPSKYGCFTCLLPSMTTSFLEAGRQLECHASVDPNYSEWFKKHRITAAEVRRQQEIVASWNNCPLISIVTPVFKPKPEYLQAMIDSVLAQSYGKFELLLINASGVCPEVDAVLNRIVDNRVRVFQIDNSGISGNTNFGIKHAVGDYIAFIDHDDVIEADALYRYVSKIRQNPKVDLLYCDEDHLRENEYFWPTFKPAFNPDLLYTHNYITHMLMISRYVLNQVELSSPAVDGAQDYDLTLKCSEYARAIENVPYMLYHWREHSDSTSVNMSSKPYAITAGRIALQSHFERMQIDVEVKDRQQSCAYRIEYKYTPKISIIIPTKDHIDLLRTCVDSILNRTKYDNYEIICVENNSIEDETFSFYEKLCNKEPKIRVIHWPGVGFNYSAICNFGAKYATSDILLFLNNDTEVIEENWMSAMVGRFLRKEVGIVGAKLCNYDGLVQHGGIWVVPGGCDYMNSNLSRYAAGYMNLLRFPSDCAAVTGACQMIRKKVFEDVGGFDEDLAVSFSDVDICLKAKKLGYLTVFEPDALLFHRESSSRGRDESDPKKLRRMETEKYIFFKRWSGLSRGYFMNINLNQYDGHFKISS